MFYLCTLNTFVCLKYIVCFVRSCQKYSVFVLEVMKLSKIVLTNSEETYMYKVFYFFRVTNEGCKAHQSGFVFERKAIIRKHLVRSKSMCYLKCILSDVCNVYYLCIWGVDTTQNLLVRKKIRFVLFTQCIIISITYRKVSRNV